MILLIQLLLLLLAAFLRLGRLERALHGPQPRVGVVIRVVVAVLTVVVEDLDEPGPPAPLEPAGCEVELERLGKSAEEKRNAAAGLPGDVDFMRAIRAFRDEAQSPGSGHCARDHTPPGDTKVTICVRKRPINRKEIRKNDHDSVTCLNPKVGRVD